MDLRTTMAMRGEPPARRRSRKWLSSRRRAVLAAAVVAALVGGVLLVLQANDEEQAEAARTPAARAVDRPALVWSSGDDRRQPTPVAKLALKPAKAPAKKAPPAPKKPAAANKPVPAKPAAPARPSPKVPTVVQPPASAKPKPPVAPRPAPSDDFSFVASIERRGDHVCTAALLNPVVLVTTWQCVDDGVSGLAARVGSAGLANGGKPVGFVGQPVRIGGSDVALLRLASPVAGAPVQVAANAPATGTRVTAVSSKRTDRAGQPLQAPGVVAPDRDCATKPVVGRTAVEDSAGADELCVRLAAGDRTSIDLGSLSLVPVADGSMRLAGTAMVGAAPVVSDGPAVRRFTDLAAHRRQIDRVVSDLTASR